MTAHIKVKDTLVVTDPELSSELSEALHDAREKEAAARAARDRLNRLGWGLDPLFDEHGVRTIQVMSDSGSVQVVRNKSASLRRVDLSKLDEATRAKLEVVRYYRVDDLQVVTELLREAGLSEAEVKAAIHRQAKRPGKKRGHTVSSKTLDAIPEATREALLGYLTLTATIVQPREGVLLSDLPEELVVRTPYAIKEVE